ncbi:MAG: hypothetical protein HON90_14690, partial [Halobacteriovoraceae bacterium]|nr:hypothetical protein [Halobacteriovoraceae bacterium]
MKFCIFILLWSICFTAISKVDKWKRHYTIVLKDIKSVEALKTSDLGLRIRLFELYGEKLMLLLEKESEFRIEYLENPKSKKLKNLVRKQKYALAKLDKIAKKIERQTKNKKILTKIHYFRALNFSLTKNDEKFFYYI